MTDGERRYSEYVEYMKKYEADRTAARMIADEHGRVGTTTDLHYEMTLMLARGADRLCHCHKKVMK